MLKDSQEFLLLLLNEIHEELKQLKWNVAGGQRVHTDSQVHQSLSDSECTLTKGSEVLSLMDDDSSCHSSTSEDDAFCVCLLVAFLLIFLDFCFI